MKLKSETKPKEIPVDVKSLYLRYCDEYSSVFIEDYGEDGVFIFHSLGRSDYRHLVEDDNTSLADKEEIICESCVLYPENYDFENCESAGLPSRLAKSILEKSLLDKPDNLQNVLHHFRDELNNSINQQISCAIHEAFPEYEIEEIDNWDIAKTCQYMAKAEFILHNLRGVPLNPMAQQEPEPEEPVQKRQRSEQATMRTQEITDENLEQQEMPKKKTKLTAAQLADLQRKFPEIDWEHDNASRGINGFMNKDFDARSRWEVNQDGEERKGQDILPEAMRNRFKVIGDLKMDSLDKDKQ